MDNKLDDQSCIMQASQGNLTSDITEMNSDTRKSYYNMNEIKKMLTQTTNQKHNSSSYKKDLPNVQDHSTDALTNKKAPQLEGGRSTKMMRFGL